ncbi:transcription termination factor [Thalictrum thalictroides]|uniref:Transcription termination factor n=1 Tax=Thalictrum thalictroides TaxID=46969 RepID=A0A7J6WZS8_THATH|nr:transcription termination factor [Thalictrum thalictroides]
MLQFPAFMKQFPSTNMIPSSVLLPTQWPSAHSEEASLAREESEFEVRLNEIRKVDCIVIGKKTVENDKEDFDNDADDDEADNAEESEAFY